MRSSTGFLFVLSLCALSLVSFGIVEKREASGSFEKIFSEAEKSRVDGRYTQAVDRYETALSIAKQRKDFDKELLCYKSAALAAWNAGMMEKSAGNYRDALNLSIALNLPKDIADCRAAIEIGLLHEKGKTFRSKSQYDKSNDLFRKAINLSKKAGLINQEIKGFLQISINYWCEQNYELFLALNKEVKRMATRIYDLKSVASSANNIGLYYWKKNLYFLALKSYFESLLISNEKDYGDIAADCVSNIGLVYLDLGDMDNSLRFLMRSLDIDQNNRKYENIAIDYNNIGIIYRNKGNQIGDDPSCYAEALRFYSESLFIVRDMKMYSMESAILNNIGRLLIDLKNYQKAEKYLQLALRKAIDRKDLLQEGEVLLNLAANKEKEQRFHNAISLYFAAEDIGKKKRLDHLLWEALFGIGRCFESLEDPEKAIEYYRSSIETLEKLNSGIEAEVFRAGYSRKKTYVYERLIDLLYNARGKDRTYHIDNEIFRYIERMKAQIFIDIVSASGKSGRFIDANSDQEEVADFINNISLAKKELAKSGLSNLERMILKEELKIEEDLYLEATVRNLRKSREMESIRHGFANDLTTIRNLLPSDNMALLDYYFGGKRSILFVITRKWYKIIEMPGKSVIEDKIRGYTKVISSHSNTRFRAGDAAVRIFGDIVGPIQLEKYPDIEELVIVPDGMLHYLPFESLMCRRRGSQYDYLIEYYKISYSPSVEAFIRLIEKARNRHKFGGGILAISNSIKRDRNAVFEYSPDSKSESIERRNQSGRRTDSLRYSDEEVKNAASLFQRNKNVIFSESSSEENVKKALNGQYQVIHFACHAIIDELNPMKSALSLSSRPDSEEDGFLEAQELYDIEINAELIVLSACQTGRGLIKRGEGILGLPRLFFYSGASSVVSALWEIDDKATALFMKRFYRYLKYGNSKGQSLRLAKTDMIKSRFKHPYYWAGFVLNGDSAQHISFN